MNLPPYGDTFRRESLALATLKVTSQSTPDMSLQVSAGTFWVNGKTLVEYAGGKSPDFTAPITNAKWCILILRHQGTLDIVNGVESFNPVFPDCPSKCLPICAVYLQNSDTVITYDMVNEIKPIFNIAPQNHSDIDGLDSVNIHPIASIVGLQVELDNRLTQLQIDNLLINKSDIDGTPEVAFVLNKDFTGTPASNCSIIVERGSENNAEIRFNESIDVWQYTNDGSIWIDLTNSGPGVPLATDTTPGTVIASTGLLVDVSGNITVENEFSTVEAAKLSGIEDNATADQSGSDIKTAYEAEADTNAYTDAEKTKLTGIEDNATTDQSGADIKAAYEAEANAYTDTLNTKLNGIEANATTDQSGADIKTAYEAEADTNAYTDAEKTKLTNVNNGGDTASRPASPQNYEMYFDTTLGHPIWYDGTNWVDSTGATV